MNTEPKITADPATWPIQNISVSGSGPTDGEMLDWLETNNARFKQNDCGWYRMRPFTGRMEDFFPTLRAAIQNAMKEGTK